jgi:hypothetical protein
MLTETGGKHKAGENGGRREERKERKKEERKETNIEY